MNVKISKAEKKMDKDEEREERINFQIIVDAYNEEEVKAGWFSYMQDSLSFPFEAEIIIKKGMDIR